ncbi:MAG: AsmA-like C-terminal region-containing protein [Ginsengibacter sp.]
MAKILKYALRTIGVIVALLFILYLIAFIYVSVNKKKIIKEVTDEISKKINGNVSIGDVDLDFLKDFPQTSVLIRKVSVTDTMFSKHHHEFFKAGEVSVELSILRLIKKESGIKGVKVINASIYLFTDTSGYTNAYLLKPKSNDLVKASTSETKSENSLLKSVELEQVRLTLDDRRREKLYDFAVKKLKVKIDDQNNVTDFSAKANIMVHSLAFMLSNGTFLKDKNFEGNFDFQLDKKLQKLKFNSINIKLAGQPFNLTGSFDLVKPDPQFSLKFHTKKISYNFAKSLLALKIDSALSIVSLDKNVDVDASISGPLNGGDPLIFVKWRVENSQLLTRLLNFDNASFSGYYTNEVVKGQPRRDPNSKINISDFSAKWNGLPLTSKNIEILNLYQPVLNCDIQAIFPLTDLNNIIGNNSIQMLSGDGLIDITYKGAIEKNTSANSFVNGSVSFKNGNLLYTPRNVELKNVNGSLVLKNSDVLIQNIQCDILDNKITMNGEAKNLMTLVTTEPNKAIINWNIYSPSLNLGSFIYLLSQRKDPGNDNGNSKKSTHIFRGIDKVLEDGRLNVDLRADRLIYKKFEASNVKANLTLLQDRYLINNVDMNHAGGNINMKGSLVRVKNNDNEAKLHVNLNSVDVGKIFAAFNNFGQNGIEGKNLEGKLTAKIDASLTLGNDGNAYPKTIVSTIDFSLKKGTLNNFEPLKKIQSFIFKNRDFANIRFAELKDRLEIANKEVKINPMEIESNVLSMFVKGVYSMNGNTDMSIQVPLKNLKRRKADYIPENKGLNAKVGASLFIRGRPGPDGNIQFKPEILHLFRNH